MPHSSFASLLDSIVRDLRYGLRVLLKKPSFFATTSLTLALGIGAATTLFSLVESQLWRPLPFPQPERLAVIWAHNLKQTWRNTSVSAADFVDWRQRARIFARLAAKGSSTPRNFDANGLVDHLRVGAVSSGFFETLGVAPAAGHVFSHSNEQAGLLNEAMVSNALALRVFGSAHAALGKSIKLDGAAYTVIGVLPTHFRLEVFRTPDVFLPLDLRSDRHREDRTLVVLGRLHEGTSLTSAQAEMDALTHQLATEHPETNAAWGARVENLRTSLTLYARTPLLLFFAFSVFVLLIACANIAGLQLIRSVVRQREFAVREALGASRWAMIRQAIAESAWIAVTGCALGILLAIWGVHALQLLPLTDMLPREGEMSLDKWSVVFAVVTSMVSTFLFGLSPGFSASKISVESALRESGRVASSSLGTRRRIELLAAGQVMLAFLSLFGVGLFVSTNRALAHVPLGFDARNILSMLIPLSGARYSDASEIREFYGRAMQQAAATPGVSECALASDLPLRGALDVNFVRAERPRPARGQEPSSLDRIVTPDYFHLLGIPILQGRGFTDHDSGSAPRVAIINQNLARHLFAGESALGKELLILAGGDPAVPEGKVQIVGIVSNTKELALNEVDFNDIYLPFAQNPDRVMFALVKSSATGSVGPLLRKKLQDLDRSEFVADTQSMDSYVAEALQGNQFRLTLIAAFATAALLLTVIALYGAVSFAVAQRTRELGLRIALGAQRTGILALTLRHILRLTTAGSVCALVIAFIAGSVLGRGLYLVPHEHSGVLYGVGIHDPLSFAWAAGVVLLLATLAGLVPGLRAMRIDPYTALRCE